MTTFNWGEFLKQWSKTIIASPYAEHFNMPLDAVKAEWLGFPGASEAQIADTEKRFGVTLPTSYREFLKTSNGWRHTGTYIERILPVEEIHWVRDTHFEEITETVKIYLASMSDFPPDEDGVDYKHLPDALVIAAPSDEHELFLLNPKVIAPDGEWQAWAFAHWIPGIAPCNSFRELLESQYEGVIQETQQEAGRIAPDDSPQVVASKLPNLISELEKKATSYRAAAGMPIGADTAEGLQEVADRLRALQSADQAILRESLLALAEELEEKHTRIQEEVRKTYPTEDLMNMLTGITSPEDAAAKSAQMWQHIANNSKGNGYAQAAGIIRYFVK